MDRVYRLPRIWSNGELRRLAPLFAGDVINVSAWKDEDKEGEHYKDYFSAATSYALSNWSSDSLNAGIESDYAIDLEADLPENLRRKFDVVFNHTTLEHVFDVFRAFGNLCELSRDLVIVVVPFSQQLHHEPSYLDYWRLTPYALRRLFERNGLKCVYESACDFPNSSVYVLSVGSRDPGKWRSRIAGESRKWRGLGRGNIRNDPVQLLSTAVYSWVMSLRAALKKGASPSPQEEHDELDC